MREIREADNIQLLVCSNPKCRNVHLGLFMHGDDEPFAMAVISGEQAAQMSRALQHALYAVAAMSDDD
jgi:hypothetical protein